MEGLGYLTLLNNLLDEFIDGLVCDINLIFQIILDDLSVKHPSSGILFLLDISPIIAHIFPKGRVCQYTLIESLASSRQICNLFTCIVLGVQGLLDNGEDGVEVCIRNFSRHDGLKQYELNLTSIAHFLLHSVEVWFNFGKYVLH
jgi:hypothetical protein